MRNDYKMPKYTNKKEEKNLMKNKNNLLKFTNIVLLITMIAIILVSGTYAKYSSSASGTDATVVANWSFMVGDQDITILGNDETVTFGLFDTINDTADGNEETDVAEGLIAPGTSGAFEFALKNTSDVTAQYEINLEVDNTDIPLEFSFDGNSWTTDLTSLVETDIMEIGENKNVTVQWRWAFDGVTDIELGGQEINVTASITASQLNNTDEVVMLNGDGQTYHTMAPSTLSFRSSANISDFQEVQVNGETIDPSNYTLTEGSTIVTLSIDYLKTLDVAAHEIAVVSNSGTTSAGFEVVAPVLNEHGFYYNQPYIGYASHTDENWGFFFRENGTMDFFVVETGYTEIATFTIDANNISVSAEGGTFNGTISADGIYCLELDTTFALGNQSVVADDEYIYTYDSSLGGYVVNAISKSQSSYGAIKTNIYDYPTVKLSNFMFVNRNGTDLIYNTTLIESPIIPNSIVVIGNDAFAGCINLNRITFEGTMEQWNAITKEQDWNLLVPAKEVECSDGTVTL